jgi:hypothetical protein
MGRGSMIGVLLEYGHSKQILISSKYSIQSKEQEYIAEGSDLT